MEVGKEILRTLPNLLFLWNILKAQKCIPISKKKIIWRLLWLEGIVANDRIKKKNKNKNSLTEVIIVLPDAAIVDTVVGLQAMGMHELSSLRFVSVSFEPPCFFLDECTPAQPWPERRGEFWRQGQYERCPSSDLFDHSSQPLSVKQIIWRRTQTLIICWSLPN